MDKNEQYINRNLHRISNILLINGGFLSNLGLYTGDMGIVLFFYRYARLTQNEIYSEYSSYLLEKIRKNIYPYTPVNYKQGLTGIGSTIEYLAQYEYFKIDTDVILEEFDKRIFFTFNLSYLSIEKITDIAYYVLWRIAGNSALKSTIINSVIPQIVNVMEEWGKNHNIAHPMVSFIKDIISSKNLNAQDDRSIISGWYQLCRNNNSDNSEAKPYMQLLEQFSNNDPAMSGNLELGFQNGLTGLGLSLISELDGDDSWQLLFSNDLILSEK